VRKQYYFRASPRGLLAWDVDRLVRLSAPFQRKAVALAKINLCGEKLEWAVRHFLERTS
jgi:hypothetical protein